MAIKLNFKVSSALKNIIGRELITDDFIAIFELVKNAFDARASEVKIIFEEDRIIIADNGKGMAFDDIEKKWLFVAYSAKKTGEEDIKESKLNYDYRDKIDKNRFYAGAKGIGRFSCDRLGDELSVITRVKQAPQIEELIINWRDFEEDSRHEFINIPVTYEKISLAEYPHLEHGTILEMSKLSSKWPRDKKLKLKQSLEKLINPIDGFSSSTMNTHLLFSILIKSDNDIEADENENSPRQRVNGPVVNFIFETLGIKTTQVTTVIDKKGEYIITSLVDRGALIYKIKEKNRSLKNLSNIKYILYYLNRAAKYNFTKLMGIEPVSFGSVFLYRNGFRVYPFGEEGEDSLKIERRKQQGVYRYLGTRDIIGRIEIIDEDNKFKETSSRDGGLIESELYEEMVTVFHEKCLKRLERYVVDIQWKISDDSYKEDISLLDNRESKNKIIRIISNLVDSNKTILLEYNKDLVNLVKGKIEDNSPESFKNLEKIAYKVNDDKLIKQIEKAKRDYDNVKKIAETAIGEATKEKSETKKELEISESENLFLKSIVTRDFDQLVNMVHDIGIYAHTVDNYIFTLLNKMRKGSPIEPDYISTTLEKVDFENKKIISLTNYISKSNYKAEVQPTNEDLIAFIYQYIVNNKSIFHRINITVINQSKMLKFVKQFKPIQLMLIIDNIISNSQKHGAKNLEIYFTEINKNEIEIRMRDDGKGLDKSIIKSSMIFEKGFTTTSGSGLGLYHVKKILGDLNAEISVNNKYKNGLELLIRVTK
ncbi:MAG: ATP-binding protein [Candidatus Delongbacteria bacterium]|nr:ATP-binding protein [Candidatus Delongbacteria bacterium]